MVILTLRHEKSYFIGWAWGVMKGLRTRLPSRDPKEQTRGADLQSEKGLKELPGGLVAETLLPMPGTGCDPWPGNSALQLRPRATKQINTAKKKKKKKKHKSKERNRRRVQMD